MATHSSDAMATSGDRQHVRPASSFSGPCAAVSHLLYSPKNIQQGVADVTTPPPPYALRDPGTTETNPATTMPIYPEHDEQDATVMDLYAAH